MIEWAYYDTSLNLVRPPSKPTALAQLEKLLFGGEMAALEMLEKLQADCRQVFAFSKQSAYADIADEIESVIDKLREEQPSAQLDTILTMFRSVGGGGEHCYSRREIEEYVEALIERPEPRHVPEEKHEHTPGAHVPADSPAYFSVCCSCGQWRCTQKSHLGRSAIIECARQHAEHVKEQK